MINGMESIKKTGLVSPVFFCHILYTVQELSLDIVHYIDEVA